MAFGFFKKNKKNVEYNPIIPNEDINDPPEDKSKRIEEIYLKQVEEKKKSDPLIGIKLCGNEIYQSFVNALREPDGHLNCNALLLNLGCFSGYVCQAAVWKKFVIDVNIPYQQAFVIMKAKSGKNYYFGDYLNYYVGEGKYSFWSLVAGMFTKIYPDVPVPDVLKMVEKVTSLIGYEEYKICDCLDPDRAVEQCAAAWKIIYPIISRYCVNPDEWPTAMGIAAQNAMNISKSIIKPDNCFNILMESSIYMSKMDYSNILVF